MSRILLADDSTHAQRMGERILREEGFEVVTVTDGNTALLRLADVDPDVIVADAFLPRRTGFEICAFVRAQPRYRYMRVVLTAGMLEELNEDEARRVDSDGVLRKPFEASAVSKLMRGLVSQAGALRAKMTPEEMAETVPPPAAAVMAAAEAAAAAGAPGPVLVPPSHGIGEVAVARAAAAPCEDVPPAVARPVLVPPRLAAAIDPAPLPSPTPPPSPSPTPPAAVRDDAPVPEIEPERVQAAVTLALDAAMPQLIDEITRRVLVALGRIR